MDDGFTIYDFGLPIGGELQFRFKHNPFPIDEGLRQGASRKGAKVHNPSRVLREGKAENGEREVGELCIGDSQAPMRATEFRSPGTKKHDNASIL